MAELSSPSDPAAQIAALQHDIKVLAWLHAEFVYQIQLMSHQLLNQSGRRPQPTTPAGVQRQQAVRARAARLAQLRAENKGVMP